MKLTRLAACALGDSLGRRKIQKDRRVELRKHGKIYRALVAGCQHTVMAPNQQGQPVPVKDWKDGEIVLPESELKDYIQVLVNERLLDEAEPIQGGEWAQGYCELLEAIDGPEGGKQ